MLRVKADSDPEADEALRLVLSGPTGGATLADPAGLGTILDDDDVLSVSISPVTEPASGVAYATVTLSLHAPLAHPASLDYATDDSAPASCETATPGADYLPTSGTLTFPAGSTTQQFTVAVLGDDVHECIEGIRLNYTNLQGIRTWPGNPDVIWIQDDDPLPVLSVSDAWLAEPTSGTAPATFHLHLSGPSSRELTVSWATANGTAIAPGDYAAGSGTLTFPAGSVDQTIDVLVAADAEAESAETFRLRLGEPYGLDGAELGDGEALGTIGPVPSGDLFIGDAAITEGNYGQRSLAFPVWLASPPVAAVTVAYATSGGTATPGVDYQPVSGVLTFSPGQSSGVVVVPVAGDWDVEADETLMVTLFAPTGGVTLARPAGVGTILDDDLQLWPDYPSVLEGAPGTAPLQLALSLSAPAPRVIRVAWATADGAAHAGEDYLAASGVVTFLPGDITRHVPLQILDDSLHESYESFQVDFLPDGQLPPSSRSVGILDDDASPTISISDAWVEEPASGSTTALFHVGLSAPSRVTTEVS
jgi:chitinase